MHTCLTPKCERRLPRAVASWELYSCLSPTCVSQVYKSTCVNSLTGNEESEDPRWSRDPASCGFRVGLCGTLQGWQQACSGSRPQARTRRHLAGSAAASACPPGHVCSLQTVNQQSQLGSQKCKASGQTGESRAVSGGDGDNVFQAMVSHHVGWPGERHGGDSGRWDGVTRAGSGHHPRDRALGKVGRWPPSGHNGHRRGADGGASGGS